jgi:hypothetical protein
MNNTESFSELASGEGAPLVVRPMAQTALKAQARKNLTRVNIGVFVMLLLTCLVLGEGDWARTQAFLHKHFSSFLLSLAFMGVLQLFMHKGLGATEARYLIYEDRLVYQKLPDQETIRFEEIREFGKIPAAILPGQDPTQAFFLFIALRNGRELRLRGFENLSEAWEILAGRFPEKIIDAAAGTPSVELLPAKTVVRYGVALLFWGATVGVLFPERAAVTLFFLGIAGAGVPYLIRYCQWGRPPTEKPQFLLVSFLVAFFVLSALILYLWT